MTEGEALAGLSKIQGLIDHPERDRFEQGLFEARNGGWTDEFRFWHIADNRQRVSFGPVGDKLSTDMAVDGVTAWSLGQTGLIITDARKPPAQTDLARAIDDMFQTRIDYLRVAGLNPHLRDAQITECKTNADGSWSALLAWNNGASEIKIAGSTANSDDLRIEEIRVTKSDRPSHSPPTWTRLSNFRSTPVWDRPIAWTVERVGDDGQVVSRLELHSIELIEPREVVALLAVPKDGTSDPIRGEISLVSISDLRPGGDGVLVKDGEVFKKVEGLQDAVPSSSAGKLWAGIVAGLAVIGILVWFGASRKKHH